MRCATALAAAALLASPAACGRRGDDRAEPGAEPTPAAAATTTPWGETPIADVGGGVITRERLERTVRARALVAEKTGQPSPDRAQLLQELVEEELLVQLAIRLGVLAGDENLRSRLVAAALQQKLPKPRNPTDDELRAFVHADPGRFPRQERLHLRHIVVRAPPPAPGENVNPQRQRAERIRAQVSRAPATFEAEARRQSADPSAQRGGDLGYLPVDRFAMVLGQDFPAAVAGVGAGKVGPIVRSAQGFHVFMVVDRKPADADPLEVQRREVVAAFMEDARQRDRRALLDRVRAEIAVRIHDPSLAQPGSDDR